MSETPAGQPGAQRARFVYPGEVNPTCPGSGEAVAVGAVRHGYYADCPRCGRRTFVHPKGALHKHSTREVRRG